jgi:hypothetical protein
MQQLTQSQLTNLRNALLQAHQHHQDPKLHLLYGALYTLHQHQQLSLLDHPFSLAKLYEHSNALDAQHTKVKKAEEYTHFLAQTLQIENKIYISDIQELLINSTPQTRDNLLKKYFTQHSITYDPNITYNDAYLAELNPNKEPHFIANIEIDGEFYQLVSLITKAQMKKESEQLGHCVGESDFYIEKVRDGKILVLSLRDSAGISQYTIEYDIKNKSIKQFKGKDNQLPDKDKIITATLDALTQAGYPITNYTEDLDKLLFYQDEHHHINHEIISLEQLKSIHHNK